MFLLVELSIPTVESYKYLGIELSAANDCLIVHWEKLSERADKAINETQCKNTLELQGLKYPKSFGKPQQYRSSLIAMQ